MKNQESIEILGRKTTTPLKKLVYTTKCICDKNALDQVDGHRAI